MAQNIKTRRGRPPKWLSYSFDQCADKGFQLMGAYIDHLMKEWSSLSLEDQAQHVQHILPLSLKRIPDKIEQRTINMNIPVALAERMAELYERNALILKDLARSGKLSRESAHDAGEAVPGVPDTGLQ